MTVYSSSRYRLDWPGHVFPTQKYDGIRERLLSLRPQLAPAVAEPPSATREQILTVHEEGYLQRIEDLYETPHLAYREFEVPVSEAVMEALGLHTGGSIMACRDAAESKLASVNLGGGFHHAFAAHGEGFCIINDVAVGLRVAQREGWIETAAVIDCDLHQGNGTAHIFQGDRTIYTFSIHQQNNYPVKQDSDWDIGLEDFADDARYLSALGEAVPQILDSQRPDLVFYLAGADPYAEDQLGALMLSLDGLRARDRIVFGHCRERGIPVAVALAGGYARRPEDVTLIHTNMVLDLMDVLDDTPQAQTE
jgi:acetoin utilization deacetylase AcuC-like enzyme